MRRTIKRIAAITCAAALMISMTACSTASTNTTTANDASPAAQDGAPPEKPDGDGAPGGFGGSGEVTQGTSANTIDTDTTVYSSSYTSTGDDENALRVDGVTVTLNGVTVDKRANPPTRRMATFTA